MSDRAQWGLVGMTEAVFQAAMIRPRMKNSEGERSIGFLRRPLCLADYVLAAFENCHIARFPEHGFTHLLLPPDESSGVIFSQMVNDPEDAWRLKNPGREPNKQEKGHWTRARQKLFEIIEDLVKWENTTNEEVLERAREEIRKSWRDTCDLNKDHPQAAELFDPDRLPAFHDPFAGGGAIPLEAQRLGLESYASDLNPVAVLINKAMIEIPPKFAGREPVNPEW
jgi:hypothetical protein